MSLAKASVWTASSTLVKIAVGLLVVKLLAISYGPEGVGQAGNFRQLITVLGVLAGAGIFNGVTTFVAQYRQQPQPLRALVGTASAMVTGFSTLLALVFACCSPCQYRLVWARSLSKRYPYRCFFAVRHCLGQSHSGFN